MSFTFKIEQVAIATDNPQAVKAYLSMMDVSFSNDSPDWVEDTVRTLGKVYGENNAPSEPTVADLSFHYGTGIEFEILDYREGPNWHKSAGRSGTFLSHIGMHVDEFPDLPFELIQDVKTVEHTNEYLVNNGRKYIYKIYNTRGLFGFDLKLIKRVEKGEV